MLQLVICICNGLFLQPAEPSFPIFHQPLADAPLYKAKAMKPATAAARPISSLPAAPVDSARPPEDVPVAPAAPVPEGLGAEPVAVARVPLLEVSTLRPPVLDAEAEAPVPLGLTEPVEVGTLVAVVVLAFVPFPSTMLRYPWYDCTYRL
jgi:hypothetical protein